MDRDEFDKFAEEYAETHKGILGPSGEDPEFFAAYKVADTARLARAHELTTTPAILDFGCGVGNSLPWFAKEFSESKVTALDVSAKSLEIARARFADTADFVQFDGATIPGDDNRFDIAFSACVFHHIPHDEHIALLSEIHRVLRPGGMLAIFEHNTLNPLTMRAVRDCAFDENAVLIKSRQLLARFRAAGFAAPRREYRIFFPRALRWLRPLEAAMRWLPLGAQYSVHARK